MRELKNSKKYILEVEGWCGGERGKGRGEERRKSILQDLL